MSSALPFGEIATAFTASQLGWIRAKAPPLRLGLVLVPVVADTHPRADRHRVAERIRSLDLVFLDPCVTMIGIRQSGKGQQDR